MLERYHYPNQYRGLVLPGRRFVYYRGVKRSDGSRRPKPEYFGTGVIGDVWQDPRNDPSGPKRHRRWYASISDYRPLSPPVPWDEGGAKLEQIASNRFAVAVRELAEEAHEAILRRRGHAPGAPSSPPTGLVVEVADQKLVPSDRELLAPSTRGTGTRNTGATRGGGGGRSLRSKVVGDRGERLVFEFLQAEAERNGWTHLRWPAREGELPGWDIEYRDGGQLVSVEVKSTVAPGFDSIGITRNEWAAAKKQRGHYRLALVAGVETKTPRLEWVDDPWGLTEKGQMTATPMTLGLTRNRSRG